MDQVRAILKVLQKHHFWLLCVLAVIIGMVGWMMGSSRLSADYTAKKGDVLSRFTAMQGLRSADKPPNSKWKEGISKLTDVERKKVREAWELCYDEQKKLLEWPKELGDDFLDAIKRLPADGELSLDLLNRYKQIIKSAEFPKLLAIVDAKPDFGPVETGSGPRKPPVQIDPNREYTMTWSKNSQEEVESLLEWKGQPTTAEVRRAQEDLWVLQAVLGMIRDTNKGVHVARVKHIAVLQIGKKASREYEQGLAGGHVEHLQKAEADPAAASGAGGAGTPDADAGPPAADDGRYVDEKGTVLAAGTAHEQFKRIPVHLLLMMDQREITKLLVECANSPLPLEVRQLRINPGGKPQSSDRAGGLSGGGAANDGVDVPVEINGIVYIFVPPDAAKLGGELAAGDAAAPAAAPGS